MLPSDLRRTGLVALGGLLVGLGLGYRLYHSVPAPVEAPAPAIRQKDGSTVLERKPDPKATPSALVPKGGKVERIVRVTVTPIPELPAPREAGSVPAPEAPEKVCPSVTVELDLVRMPDGSRRVVAKAENGTLLEGVDIPVEPVPKPRELRWAVGAVRGFDTRTRTWSWGAGATYRKGPFVGGLFGTSQQVQVFAGVAF